MLDAARVSVRFYCPACGAGLRAPCSDGGSVIGCHICGEAVRVPHGPHPLESDVEDTPAISPAATVAARRGVGVLLGSLGLGAIEYALLVAVVGYWLLDTGPMRLLARHPSLGAILLTVWILDLARAAARWMGYLWCEPAAEAMQSRSWAAAARVGTVVRSVGCTAIVLPWLLNHPGEPLPILLRALGDIGKFTWLTGVVLECGSLVVWYRVLAETEGRGPAGLVGRYAATAGLGLLTLSSGVCLVGMVAVMTLRRNGLPPRGPVAGLDLDTLPPEGWHAILALFTVAVLLAAVLGWQYFRILSAVRAGLAPPRR
jgi:hypothetical protein